MRIIAVGLAAIACMGAAPVENGHLKVSVDGLRSGKGLVHLCLTQSANRFLHCKNGAAVARTLKAGEMGALDLGPVKPGTYALLIVHDENGNGKLDMTMGIPREGFGFSNNPAMRPRAPRWEEIHFTMPAASHKQQIRVRYVL